jgi:2-oxoglutarate ferredoxin oxidoreductase subunit beta
MNVIPLSPKDFTTDQEVRWCPGCGDYAILKGVRTALAEIGRKPDDVVFISGIGCAARFPYYVASYGFHTIHGRAPAIATGVKLANPDLDVWVVGGDGDFLSIGGNHLIHTFRRDVDLNLLLLNNEIYGLTKGQYSPTSPIGTRSPSTPGGSVEQPVSAALLALGAGASFVARAVDSMQDHLPGVLVRAHAHRGASLVEILQNCIIYFDGAFGPLGEKGTAPDAGIRLVHGEPMRFGKEQEKGLVFDESTCRFAAVTIGPEHPVESLAIHDESNLVRATALASLGGKDGEPTALGVIYQRPPDAAKPGLSQLSHTPPMSRDELSTLLARAS